MTNDYMNMNNAALNQAVAQGDLSAMFFLGRRLCLGLNTRNGHEYAVSLPKEIEAIASRAVDNYTRGTELITTAAQGGVRAAVFWANGSKVTCCL